MASNYTTAATAAADAGFQERVRIAMYAACARIGSGDFTGNQRAYFTGLIHQVIANPDLYVTTFTHVLAGFMGLDNTCADSDLDNALNKLWPAISGYLAAGG
jgi:hypothetical protein